MKVSKKQKRLFVRTMICTVSLVTACFFCSSLEAAAAPRAQETGERVTIVTDTVVKMKEPWKALSRRRK